MSSLFDHFADLFNLYDLMQLCQKIWISMLILVLGLKFPIYQSSVFHPD